jgi:alanine dehydrogenase
VESWRNRKTLILGRTDMIGLLTPAEYNDCVEHAYRMHALGRVSMEPKGHIVIEQHPGEWEVMPSYIEDDPGTGRPEAAACKWVSIREDNRRFELPAVFSILVYTHPETGFPLAICDGSHHTLMRTGSSAAVSAKWLARPGSRVLAIVGAGSVGQGSLLTCAGLFPWAEVRIWSRSQESVDRFLAEMRPRVPELALTGSTDVERVVRDADVIVTGTHARSWLIDDAWVSPGAHIAALGADLAGEQELDPRILQRARVFVDDIRQCREDGEINVALREGQIAEADVAGELGQVIVGELEGRQSDDQITVFDSTGIALQDSATVPLEYERALAAGVGVEKKMIST